MTKTTPDTPAARPRPMPLPSARLAASSALAWAALACSGSPSHAPLHHDRGAFELSRDIGDVGAAGELHPESDSSYRIRGAGADVWSDRDAFHFASRELSGDVTLSARVEWLEQSSEIYRKALLMLRDGLEPDAAYADVALHGGGLTALQYRPYAGAPTLQLPSELSGARYARIERRGGEITAYFSREGHQWSSVGPVPVELPPSVQAGIGLCSHDAGRLTSARFSELAIDEPHE